MTPTLWLLLVVPVVAAAARMLCPRQRLVAVPDLAYDVGWFAVGAVGVGLVAIAALELAG